MNQVISVVLTANTASFKSQMTQAAASAKSFGTAVETSGDKASKAAQASAKKTAQAQQLLSKVALGVGVGLLAGFGAAAGAAMRFDQQMSATGAAASATGSQLNALREQALQMGADTAFSATEAAQAQEELSKAGLTTAEILGGALPAALTLAASNSLDLATASTYMADAMTMFNLEASQSGHVADVLAAAAGKSSTDVDGLSQALNQTGLVADQFGISIESTAGTLAMFASAGLKGSDAGTSLKTALMRLAAPSGRAAAEMERLGINAFDTQGNFIGMAGLAEELQQGLAGMTMEQRNATLALIGGADAIRPLSILYDEGAGSVREWEAAANDSGYASEQAAARMDNLAGDLEALGGSLETALIQGGSKATGALRFLAQGATDAVNSFSELPGWAQSVAVGIAGIGGAALTVVGGLGIMTPKLKAGMLALEAMGPAGQAAAGGLRSVGGAAGKLALLGVAVYGANALADALMPLETADLSKLERDLMDLGRSGRVTGEAADILGDDLGKLNDALHRVGEPANTERIKDTLGNLTSFGGDTKSLEQARARIDDVDKALASLAARDPEAAAATFDEIAEAANESGISTGALRGMLNDYDSALAETETANETAGGAIEETTGAVDDQGNALTDTAEAIQGYSDALTALTDPVFGMTAAMQGHRDATTEVAAAELELAAARDGGNALEIMAAETALGDARLARVESAAEMEQAELALAAAIEQNPALIDEVNRKLYEFVARGEITQAEAIAMADALGIYNQRAGEVPERIESSAELHDNVTTPLETINARLLGWDGETGTADAFLEDFASTPMGLIQMQLLNWDGSSGTADVNAEDADARVRLATSRDSLHGWDASSGTASVNADDRSAAATQAFARERLAAWDRASGSASVNATDNASGTISKVARNLSALDGRTATVTITNREIRQQITEVGTRPMRMPTSRWGNVTDAAGKVISAQSGYWWDQAGIATSPTMFWGERETGGEAYIPKNGNRERSLKILGTAASWHGMQLVPKDAIAAQAGYLLGSAASSRSATLDLSRGFVGVEEAIHEASRFQVAAASMISGYEVATYKGYLRWLEPIKTGVWISAKLDYFLARAEQRGHSRGWALNAALANVPDFDKGGTVPGRIGQPVLIRAHGGEQVTPPGELRGSAQPAVVNYHLGASVTIEMRTGDILDQGGFMKKVRATVDAANQEQLQAQIRQLRKRPGR